MTESNTSMVQTDELNKDESRTRQVQKADAAVKIMNDFTSPEELYQELVRSIRKYHPSTDISMIENSEKENMIEV